MLRQSKIVLPLEVRFLVASLRWPISLAEKQALVELAAEAPDWEEVFALAAHHRVLPLAYRNLSEAAIEFPAGVRGLWRTAATRNAYAAMRSLAETARLQALLGAARITVRVLKGVPLSMRAYGDPSLRDIGDIDLLIAPAQDMQADLLLLADGYRRRDPAARLTPRRRASYRKHVKDYTYAPGEAGFEIDLHWRLFRNPEMPGNALATSGAVAEVELGSERFLTLPPAETLLHLCVHGALDGWIRLKSLADIAALWRACAAGERDTVLRLARRDGVVPELAAALLLACGLRLADHDELPPSLLLLESDRTVSHVLEHALTQFHQSRFRPDSAMVGSWRAKRYELGLRTAPRYRFEILRRVLFRPRVWESFDLPDPLFPLYALLSPLEWLLFHFRQRVQKHERPSFGPAWFRSLKQRWTGWRKRGVAERVLLLEAASMLLAARVALRLFPAGAILRWVRSSGLEIGSHLRPADVAMHGNATAVERVCSAVLAASRHAPLRFVCFPQALAAHTMLRYRHIDSEVIYGVRRSAEGKLRAHTWLRVGERTVLGGETEPLFAPLDPWRSRQPET